MTLIMLNAHIPFGEEYKYFLLIFQNTTLIVLRYITLSKHCPVFPQGPSLVFFPHPSLLVFFGLSAISGCRTKTTHFYLLDHD